MSDVFSPARLLYYKVLPLSGTALRPSQALRKVWRPFFDDAECLKNFSSLLTFGCWPPGADTALQTVLHTALGASPSEPLSRILHNPKLRRRLSPDLIDLLAEALREISPAKPFLRHLGALVINTSSRFVLTDPKFVDFDDPTLTHSSYVPKYLADRFNGVTPTTDSAQFQRSLPNPRLFGYDPKLADQRMNLVPLELYRPVRLTLRARRDSAAHGWLQMLLYPCGYAVIEIDLCLSWPYDSYPDGALERLATVFRHARPWNTSSDFIFSSRLGTGSLAEIVARATAHLHDSMYDRERPEVPDGQWRGVAKLTIAPRQKTCTMKLLEPVPRENCEELVVTDDWGNNKWFLTRMYAPFEATAGRPCSDRGSGCSSLPS